ncbi:MAG: NnrU family protein [Rhizobiales bacterium]|nr:NnrU family protein [Hyphomicrobiales bacterium]
MIELILASLAFMLVHLVPMTGLRPWLFKNIGEKAYLAVFSLVSIVLLVLMVRAYGNAAPGEPLWIAGAVLSVILALLMLAAFWLLVAANTERNPAAVGGGAVLEKSAVPHGVFTITRHPLMIAIALWAFLHLIANAELPSLVFFGSLIVTALGGSWAQDWRKEREIGVAWRRYRSHTSFMPFRAILEGRTRLDASDITWWRAALAVVLWLIFLVGHGPLFGVPALVL